MPAKNTTFFTTFFRSSGFIALINKYLCAKDLKTLVSPFSQLHNTHVNNTKNVEGLALILVQTLDLNIKQGVRVNLDA